MSCESLNLPLIRMPSTVKRLKDQHVTRLHTKSKEMVAALEQRGRHTTYFSMLLISVRPLIELKISKELKHKSTLLQRIIHHCVEKCVKLLRIGH